MKTDLGRRIRDVRPAHDEAGKLLCYLVYLDPDGLLVVSADDWIEPVIAFSRSGDFTLDGDGTLAVLLRKDLASRLAGAARAAAAKPGGLPEGLARARGRWERLISESEAAASSGSSKDWLSGVSDMRVAPLLTSRWNQGSVAGSPCFNYYTPNHYVAGCVATAMAQWMRHLRYPAAGVGTAGFSIRVDGVLQTGFLRGGDGLGGAYDWDAMVGDPGANVTDAQRRAIGALCHDAGVAANMSYGVVASSAYMSSAQRALREAFGFSHVVRGSAPGGDIGAGLNEMLNPNLDAAVPAMLSVHGEEGGHAVLCDGYGYHDGTLYHHLNMGWGGLDDAWYNLPNVDAYYDFNAIATCLYNLYRQGSGEIVSGRVMDRFGMPLAGAAVSLESGDGSVILTGWSRENGVYAIAQVPSDRAYTLRAAAAGHVTDRQPVSVGLSQDNADRAGNRWNIDFALWEVENGDGGERLPWPDRIVLDQVRPAFAWEPVAGAGWYCLWINRNGSLYFSQWLRQAETTWIPPFDLEGGEYKWWIRSWGETIGLGDWSAAAAFEIASAVPAAAELLAPISAVSISRPVFEWSSVPGATWYGVRIHRADELWVSKWLSGATRYVPDRDLPYGHYSWWVRTSNGDGEGEWSEPVHFRYGVADPLEPANGEIAKSRWPELTWSRVADATWYYVWVARTGGESFGRWVRDRTTWALESALAGGQYRWWILIWDPENNERWSRAGTFTVPVAVPGEVAGMEPVGWVDGTDLAYTWNADPAATEYLLWISKNGHGWQSVSVDAVAGAETMTQPVAGHVSGSTYRWWVQARSPDGEGPWSEPVTFTVE